MMDKKRLYSFDICKLLAIFFVLWGHSIQSFVSGPYESDIIWIWLQSFHMPLFIIISGYFSGSSLKLGFVTLLKKKSLQLLLPCITWGLIIYLIRLFVGGGNFSLLETIVGNFWFLKSVFICYLFIWIASRMSDLFHSRMFGYSVFLLVSLFIPQYNIIRLFPCFLFGSILKEKNLLKTFMEKKIISISVVLFCFLLLFYINLNNSWVYGSIADFWGNNSLLCSFAIGYVVRILMGLSGSMFFLILCHSLFDQREYVSISPFMSRVVLYGQETLGIYIIQTNLLEKALAAVINLDHLPYLISYFVIMPLISIAVIWMCVQLIRLVSKNKLLAACLIGKVAK